MTAGLILSVVITLLVVRVYLCSKVSDINCTLRGQMYSGYMSLSLRELQVQLASHRNRVKARIFPAFEVAHILPQSEKSQASFWNASPLNSSFTEQRLSTELAGPSLHFVVKTYQWYHLS